MALTFIDTANKPVASDIRNGIAALDTALNYLRRAGGNLENAADSAARNNASGTTSNGDALRDICVGLGALPTNPPALDADKAVLVDHIVTLLEQYR
jgi:hypothetical protein